MVWINQLLSLIQGQKKERKLYFIGRHSHYNYDLCSININKLNNFYRRLKECVCVVRWWKRNTSQLDDCSCKPSGLFPFSGFDGFVFRWMTVGVKGRSCRTKQAPSYP